MAFKKNAAVTGFPFLMVSSVDGSAITAGVVTGYYKLPGVAQGAIAGVPVHEGNGQWTVDLLAAEMNGDLVGLLFTHANAAPVHFTIKTEVKSAADVIAAGDVRWITAIGFAVPGDSMALIAAAVTAIDTKLSTVHGSDSWETTEITIGAGAVKFEVTVQKKGTTDKLDGVSVWITTDVAGLDVVAGPRFTNANGYTYFMLDVGSYYLWAQKGDYNFEDEGYAPKVITVTET